jgi:predicted ATPase
MPRWTLRLRDFRTLASLEWSPEGVCLLGGPNGSGKTTVLRALQFPRNTYAHGLNDAVRFLGGSHIRRRSADPDALVVFEIEVEELRWTVQVTVEGVGIHPYHGERLTRGDEVVFEVKPLEAEWRLGGETRGREDRCPLRVLQEKWEPGWLEPLIDLLTGMRVYESYWLNQVREPARPNGADVFLHPTGRNLWTVLANWKAAPRRYGDQFAWVLEGVREAFPGLVKDIEFAPDPVFFPPDAEGSDDWLPVHLAADGLLTGILHLTAVAGAKRGSTIAFDEVENQLHPHAIRTILRAMRQKADERNLTILLTTHSPVVMNEFKGQEHRFYVLEVSGDRPILTSLDKARDPDWLAHFALGDLYEGEGIARQSTTRGY